MNIVEAIDDPEVFGSNFRDPESWAAWRAFLAALFALPMTPAELATYRACSGRTDAPTSPHTEAWLVCGRRAGKSYTLALIAVYLACFRDWRPHLAPGERATVMVIAADRKQARVILRYVHGLLTAVPMLAGTIEREATEAIDLSNRVSIEVNTASFRTTRGYSIAAALCDEIAYWPTDDSASPDTEILAALRPAMATLPGALLLCASSPYSRRGALWQAHQRHHGKDGSPVLVWQAATRTMNPSVPQHIVDEALAADPAHARAEYLAEFRSDVESYVRHEAVAVLVPPGCRERPPSSDIEYFAFVDPSGGSADSMTLAIGHKAGDTVVLDALRERRPPFSPEGVVQEFAALLHRYGLSEVTGDRYAGEWPREQFRKRGIDYELSPLSKSDLYRDLLPVINSAQADLLDDDRLVSQLTGLERRTARGGRDTIDHGPGGHDDVANAAAGCLVLAHTAGANRLRSGRTSTMGGPQSLLVSSRPQPQPVFSPPHEWRHHPHFRRYFK
ncbi:hypothetical protein BH23PLA1_BH23PLA1_44930 [soil metagenome]